MPSTRRLLLTTAALGVCCLSLSAQQKAKAPPPVTGLEVRSVTIDPANRDVVVTVQNVTTNKIAVGWAVLYHQFDKDGKEISAYGGAIDYAGPEPNSGTQYFIHPGRSAEIRLTKAIPDAVSVTASMVEVVYEDRSWEGEKKASVVFATRREAAKAAREEAAEAAKSGDKERKAELEERAAWLEAHGPKEER